MHYGNAHSNASRAAAEKLKITRYTLHNNRCVASSRRAELAVLSVFEIIMIFAKIGVSSLAIVNSDFSASRAATDKPKEMPYTVDNSI